MAAFDEVPISGMAGEIRASTTSDQFDLAGVSQSRVTETIKNAFGSPLRGPKTMVKFQFIVGGGKLVRSKYNEELPKWVNAALREIGFESDASAAETFDSQGTFKQQHDTGKNLIYIIVYPRVACSEGGADGEDEDEKEPAVNTKSPEYIVSACELDTFKDIVRIKLPYWRQRKACLKILQEYKGKFDEIEAKLMSGKPLAADETALYESNSGQDTEKIAYLQYEIKALVDAGQLVASEKRDLLATLASNLAEAQEAKQEKKIENINTRRAALEKVTPILGRLKHGDQVQALRLKLLPLLALEDKGRSMSLTIADLQTLSDKPEIEEAIAGYEQASRGWFEEDEDVAARCAYEEAEAKKKYTASKGKAQKKKGLGSGGKTGTQVVRGTNVYHQAASWGSIGKATARPGGGKTAKAPAAPKVSASFANAFGDDSD